MGERSRVGNVCLDVGGDGRLWTSYVDTDRGSEVEISPLVVTHTTSILVTGSSIPPDPREETTEVLSLLRDIRPRKRRLTPTDLPPNSLHPPYLSQLTLNPPFVLTQGH